MPIAARREAPDLFDAIKSPPTSLTPDVETDLLRLLQVMFEQIGSAMKGQEADDDQDHARASGASCLRLHPAIDG